MRANLTSVSDPIDGQLLWLFVGVIACFVYFFVSLFLFVCVRFVVVLVFTFFVFVCVSLLIY